MDNNRVHHDEDEGLWEELQSQHARGMQQHQARHHHPRVRQTSSDVARGFSVFYQAAVDAWKEHKLKRIEYRAVNLSNSVDLQDFGIPSSQNIEEEDPTMIQYTSFHDNSQQNKTDFVFLPQLRWRPRNEGWGAVSNLDLYFQSLYSYFYHRGLVPIIGKGIVELLTLIFTLVLSVFLFAYVDWHALSQCTDESTCRPQFSEYIRPRPRGTWLVVIYSLIFLVYTLFAFTSFSRTLQDALQAKWVFEERLGISSHRLLGGAVDWDHDVVAKILELQQSGTYRIAIHGQELDALVIAQRIMRKENFLVALFNRQLLDLTVPGIQGHLLCPSLEWSLYFCILNFMFNHKYQIRPAFYLDPASLRRRFILCGIAHLIFMPFLLFFLTLYFGLSNAYDWKNSKRYLGPKDWSLHAKWTFREFNELTHHFERRLAPSYKAAENYLNLFGASEILATIGRICVFLGGSLGAVLFALAALNDAILLHIKIADWNLLWYAGIVGALYSLGKALIPTDLQQPSSARNLYDEMNQSLETVAKHTHYYPEIWKGRGWDPTTFQAFSAMFQYKAKNFAREVLALILAPYILCVSLADCAEPICEFILAIKKEVPGAGDVCGYATFDFNLYQDETFGGRVTGTDEPMTGTLTESVMLHKSVQDAVQAYPKPKAKLGKMKQSLNSFRETHPSWQCTTSVPNPVESRTGQMEQDLHRDVVARQLETLAALEENITDADEPGLDLHYSYIRPAAAADAGTHPAQTLDIDFGSHRFS